MGQDNDKGGQEEGFYNHRDLTSDYYQVMIERGRPRFCKILWGFVILGFLGFTGYMIYSLLKSYLEYKSFNSVNDKWTSSVKLPALMICSTNYLNYTEIKEELVDDDEDDDEDDSWVSDMIDLFNNISLYNGSVGIENYINQSLVKKLDAANLKDSDDEKIDNIFTYFTMDIANFLLGDGENHPYYKFASAWQTLNIPDDIDKLTNTTTTVSFHKFGTCLRLNDDQSLVQTIGGKDGGFTIDLNARTDNYLLFTETIGFKLYLLSPNETLIIDKEGILVAPGTENFIEINKQEVKRQKAPFGSCEKESSDFYPSIDESVRECEQRQYLKSQVKKCKCLPWYLWGQLNKNGNESYLEEWAQEAGFNDTTAFNTTSCGFATQALCDVQVIEDLRKQSTSGTADTCPEPCKFLKWEYNMFSVPFPPTESYYNTILEPNMESAADGSSYNFTYASNNYVRIHVYYPQIKKTTVEQEKAYEISNFIAEFGGTVDLLIGFSFFTVFQVLEIAVACCMYRCGKKRGPSPGAPADKDLHIEMAENPRHSATIEE